MQGKVRNTEGEMTIVVPYGQAAVEVCGDLVLFNQQYNRRCQTK